MTRMIVALLFSFCLPQAVQAQNIFQRFVQPNEVAPEATPQAQPETAPEPEPEPTLRDVVKREIGDYPVVQWQEEYQGRAACIERLQLYYDQALLGGTYTIPQSSEWLEVYPEGTRQIYICDGATLTYYFDKNNNVPSRWMMVRNALDQILASK